MAVLRGSELASLKSGLAQTWGGEVNLAMYPSVPEALQALDEHGRADFFALDLDIPGEIGSEAARIIRENPELESMPVLMVSRDAPQVEALDTGRTILMPKPVIPQAWKEALVLALAIPLSHEKAHAPAKVAPEGPQAKARKAKRAVVETVCTVTVGGRQHKGTLHDVSVGGAKFSLDADLPVGGLLSFSFAIPGSVPLRFIYLKARVMWRTDDGYGISFWEMDTLTRTFLAALVR